jgi:HPt (histidine-containing phosphotransfer) domain-containing protein
LSAAEEKIEGADNMANLTSPQAGLFNLEVVLDRVGGDEELLQEIAAIFLAEYPVLLTEIRDAVRSTDPQRLERAAHTLKGSVSNFGADSVTRAALSLEQIGRRGEMESAANALLALEAQLQVLDPALNELITPAP